MTLPSAGWYPDPDNTQRSRWWGGSAWTDNYSDYQAPAAATVAPPATSAATAQAAPMTPYDYSANAAPLTAPAGTQWSTVWIWLIVALPLLSTLSIFAIDWQGIVSARTEVEMMQATYSPGYFIVLVLSFAAYGASVWFAYLDYRELGRRSVPQPFHWAWSFLQSGVYPIGRSVVVKRRVGRGISPMWVTIAILVGSMIFSVIFTVSLTVAMLQSIPSYSGF